MTEVALHLDSAAAIIWQAAGPRYLLQHREDRTDIAYPNWWSLFGGALEVGESAEQALRREMIEELGLYIGDFSLLFSCTFDLRFAARRVRKTFFDVEITRPEAEKLTLKEGQGMAWLRFDEMVARAEQVVPCDLGALALHHGACSAPRPRQPSPINR